MCSKTRILVFILLWMTLIFSYGYSENPFSDYFLDETLRIDYYHIGDAKNEFVALDGLFRYKGWAGNVTRLIDDSGPGRYMAKVFDRDGKKLLFTKNYNSIFDEYQTTQAALSGKKRAYEESVLIPFPKDRIILVIESRDKNQAFQEVFREMIDPEDITIRQGNPDPEAEVYTILDSGDPHRKVDLLLVAEGYTKAEKEKFRSDGKRLSDALFREEPFAGNQDNFNVRAVYKPSQESGCDEPGFGIFRNTVAGASFDALGSERYLLTEHNRRLRNLCANATYDTIIIIVNTKRYGGGGIYNLYATCISDNQWTNYVFIHEFGHSFAALADEYFTSKVELSDFHPVDREPLEPNITALLSTAELKWKNLVKPGTELPTPWDKNTFETQDLKYQEMRDIIYQKLAQAKKKKAPDGEIKKIEDERERLSLENARKVDKILVESKNSNVVGAFEGAGYRSKGLYRSMVDCIMFTKGDKPFCKACQEAIEKRIRFYCQ